MNIASELTFVGWLLALAAAFGIGMSKAGLPLLGMLPMILMASVMDARESTGMVLILLLVGDVFAIYLYSRHARWKILWKLIPSAFVGIILGSLMMGVVPTDIFKKFLGTLLLLMLIAQLRKKTRIHSDDNKSHSKSFFYGITGGFTTMIANAAGPVLFTYLIKMRLSKMEFVGTGAWFFFIINLMKVPFSIHLGLMTADHAWLALLLSPIVIGSVMFGSKILPFLSEKVFQTAVSIVTAMSCIILIFS